MGWRHAQRRAYLQPGSPGGMSAGLNLRCQKQRESDYAQNCSEDYYAVHRDAITRGADLMFLRRQETGEQGKAPPGGAKGRGADRPNRLRDPRRFETIPSFGNI